MQKLTKNCAIHILDLHSDLPTPLGVLGDEAFPPTPITGHSANTTQADSRLLPIFLECLLPGSTWTSTSSLASTRYHTYSRISRSGKLAMNDCPRSLALIMPECQQVHKNDYSSAQCALHACQLAASVCLWLSDRHCTV